MKKGPSPCDGALSGEMKVPVQERNGGSLLSKAGGMGGASFA